jgi:hypothetical protein
MRAQQGSATPHKQAHEQHLPLSLSERLSQVAHHAFEQMLFNKNTTAPLSIDALRTTLSLTQRSRSGEQLNPGEQQVLAQSLQVLSTASQAISVVDCVVNTPLSLALSNAQLLNGNLLPNHQAFFSIDQLSGHVRLGEWWVRKGEKWRLGTPDQCLNNPCQAREALGVSNTSHGGSLENIPIGPCGICAMCDTSTIHNGLVRNEVAAQSLRAPSATSPLTSNEHVHAPAPPSPAWSLEGPARSVDLGGFLNFNPT